VENAERSLEFLIYMLPDFEPLANAMMAHADADSNPIPLDKLQVFNRMTASGMETAAENVSMMTGMDTTVETSRISFARIEDVPKRIGTQVHVGTAVEFTGALDGYLAVLFDEQSAISAAAELLPTDDGGDRLSDRHKATIQELGNIMTSGYVDGWANVLQTSIDHTPPELVHDMGRVIVEPLAAQVGREQAHAFIIDSEMRTEEIEFSATVHALPNETELRKALEQLDVERADETDADPERIFKE
jgi:chemotaxis protein CheY-P-specific phosphatase CheC